VVTTLRSCAVSFNQSALSEYYRQADLSTLALRVVPVRVLGALSDPFASQIEMGPTLTWSPSHVAYTVPNVESQVCVHKMPSSGDEHGEHSTQASRMGQPLHCCATSYLWNEINNCMNMAIYLYLVKWSDAS